MHFKKVMCIFIFIMFSLQVNADNWKPNQVGAFLSSKIARSITDIENSAYFSQYTYNRNPDSLALGAIAVEALLANGQITEALPIGLKIAKKTTIIKIMVGISLIILKNFADLVFVEFFRATRHFPK